MLCFGAFTVAAAAPSWAPPMAHSYFTAVRRAPPYEEVLYEVKDRIAWITMCCPRLLPPPPPPGPGPCLSERARLLAGTGRSTATPSRCG